MQELIKKEYFTQKWLTSKSQKLSGDPILIEKALRAFALLGYLVQLEKKFVFKGGTSLLLHMPKIKRLSIDIDIIFSGDIDNFITKISEIPKNAFFTRFEENERGHRGLPNRRHFKFFYISALSNSEESILLDIVLDNPDYIPFTETKLIKTDLFKPEIELQAKVPTIEGLLGDKLTAFAPHTIGVPFETKKGQTMTMQVVKQLYDIGELFDIASNFKNIVSAFNATFKKENGYKDSAFSRQQVLKDTIDTCLTLLQIRLRGFKTTKEASCLEDGIKRIDSHLLNSKFRTDNEAKITASKVFCIASRILDNIAFNFHTNRYDNSKNKLIKDITLPAPYEKLNRLKQVLPEAFYYVWRGINK